jgi:hypothetical protein
VHKESLCQVAGANAMNAAPDAAGVDVTATGSPKTSSSESTIEQGRIFFLYK